jgi:hypothetical protein
LLVTRIDNKPVALTPKLPDGEEPQEQ